VRARCGAIGGVGVLAVVIPLGIISGRSAAPGLAADAATSAAARVVPFHSNGHVHRGGVVGARSGRTPGLCVHPEAFAAEREGQTVSFPETVTAVNLRGGTTTRFDIGISPGDEPENSTRGLAYRADMLRCSVIELFSMAAARQSSSCWTRM
jgi:hypothetical protein